MPAHVMSKAEFVESSGVASMSPADENVLSLQAIADALHAYHTAPTVHLRDTFVAIHLVKELCMLYMSEEDGTPDDVAVNTLREQAEARVAEFTNPSGNNRTPESRTLAQENWRRALRAVKPVSGGGQKLAEGYWLELATPHLSVSRDVRDMFETWKSYPTAMSFVDWLRQQSPGMFPNYAKVGYDSQVERRKYLVVADSGTLRTAEGAPFHTGGMRTAFSGNGWAIFVRGTDGTLYSGSHIGGQRHHSSFLEGGPVLAAGEWAVDNGKIVGLKNKSGHYRPTPQMLYEFLMFLTLKRMALDGVPTLTDPVSPQQRFYDAAQLKATGGISTSLAEVQAPPSPPVV